MEKLTRFNRAQIDIIDSATALAEELVINHYKMSASQWLRPKYDVKTLADLSAEEIVHGPFAQIIRYEGHRGDAPLGSTVYDFYKICLQDHAIIAALEQHTCIALFPFTLYIVVHELIHIVRFSKFLQNFNASWDEKMDEEKRVHTRTHEILQSLKIDGLEDVFRFYANWRPPIDGLASP